MSKNVGLACLIAVTSACGGSAATSDAGSADGVAAGFTMVSSGVTEALDDITGNGSKLFAGGAQPVVSSDQGKTWQSQTMPAGAVSTPADVLALSDGSVVGVGRSSYFFILKNNAWAYAGWNGAMGSSYPSHGLVQRNDGLLFVTISDERNRTNNALVASSDKGATWGVAERWASSATAPGDMRGLAALPNGDVAIVSAGGRLGFFRNGVTTWNSKVGLLEEVDSLTSYQNNLYASGTRYISAKRNFVVMHSRDGANTWQELWRGEDPMPPPNGIIMPGPTMWARSDKEIYLINAQGTEVLQTVDGTTWKTLLTGTGLKAIYANPGQPLVVVGRAGQIWRQN